MDFENYISGSFNIGTFLSSTNVVMIKLMKQYEDCNINSMYIKWDNILSHIADASSALVGLIVAIAEGWKGKSTYPYKSWDLMSDGWSVRNWNEMGKGVQLMFAEIASYQGPELTVEVNLMQYTD